MNSNKPLRMCAAAMLLAGCSLSATTLIENDFDAGADVGPAFQQVANGIGAGGSSDASTGIVTSGANGNSAYGLNTSSTVDASSFDGFTIEWVVASANINSNVGAPLSNGWFFGVTDSTSTAGSGLYNNASHALGIRLLASGNDMSFTQDSSGGSSLYTSLGVAVSTASSYEDGFTLSLTVNNDNTWSAFSTGLSADFSTSGSLNTVSGTGFSYADIAGSLVAYSSIQGTSLSYTADSVSLTAVPEPSAFAMLSGVLALTFVASRRRR